MRSDKELLGIQNFVVGQAEGVDFLDYGYLGLTEEEIAYIRSLGDLLRKPLEVSKVVNEAEGGVVRSNE